MYHEYVQVNVFNNWYLYNLPLLILFKYMYHDNKWWYKQSIDVDFFFELLAKTLKLLDLTQLVTCNTNQEG